VTLEVAALQQLPHLRRLRLNRCRLQTHPKIGDGDSASDDEDTADYEDPGGFDGPALNRIARTEALLTALGNMTQLQDLQLDDMRLARLTNPQYATGLTASSQLTALQVSDFVYGQPVLPKQSLQHMLPAGKQLPHLKRLKLAGHRPGRRNTTNVTAEDIAHIAAACPALDTLHLEHVLADSAAVAALSQLGGLAAGQPGLRAL
jgi:hypothetical protein